MWNMAAWQGLQNDSISSGNTRLLMIFVGVVAISMFTQAVVIIVAAVGAMRTQKRILAIAEEFRVRSSPLIDKALPIIEKTEKLFETTLPKIHTITDNLVDTSHVVKAKAHEFEVTLSDVNTKAQAQVSRIDGMVTTALTATGALAEMVHKSVRVPVLEMSGIVNGVKAGMDVLFSRPAPRMKSLVLTKFDPE